MFYQIFLLTFCVFVIRYCNGISFNLSDESSGNFIPSSLESIRNSGLTTDSPKFASDKSSSIDSPKNQVLFTKALTKQSKTLLGFTGNDRDSIQTSSSHVYPAAHHDDGGHSSSSFGVTAASQELQGEYHVAATPTGSTGLYESTGFGGDGYHHASVIVGTPTGHEYDGIKPYKTPVADYHYHEHHIKGDHGGHDGYHGYDGGHHGDGHDIGHYGYHHDDHHDGHHHDDHHHHAGFHESLLFGKALALKTLLIPLAGLALLGTAAAFVTNPVLLQLGVVTGKKKRRRRSVIQPTPFTNIFPNIPKFPEENIYPSNDNVKPDRKYRKLN